MSQPVQCSPNVVHFTISADRARPRSARFHGSWKRKTGKPKPFSAFIASRGRRLCCAACPRKADEDGRPAPHKQRPEAPALSKASRRPAGPFRCRERIVPPGEFIDVCFPTTRAESAASSTFGTAATDERVAGSAPARLNCVE